MSVRLTPARPAAAPIGPALAAVAAGEPVVLVDDHAPAGFLVAAAETVTTAVTAFLVRHSSGLLCVSLPGAECDRLDLPPMPGASRFEACVTVDAATGITTGISAHDRARTAALLAAAGSTGHDFTRPGHVIPVRHAAGGVLHRRGVAEAAADLARAAGRRPAALFAALVGLSRPTELAGPPELARFAEDHGLAAVSVGDLVTHRLSRDPLVTRRATTGAVSDLVRAVGYTGAFDGAEHLALVTGSPAGADDVPVYVHRECPAGDVPGWLRCACRPGLDTALTAITAEGCGVVVHLKPNRFRAGESGEEEFLSAVAAVIVQDLGVRSVRLPAGQEAHRAAFELRGVPAGRFGG
ncbi:3,4-dihydroxy-2-butanone-4-phosphate synthase [Amycolatopsis sp. Hca4]|uniref:3,4-dihydroxy-2-butanone-4-phosphate synthase n=1 Tax=Amycolatopsis sp. Hca4 TaxID=2742131 RepID=UPI001591B506|nr:3,4-dihydroxy-2-butanone-4-phosphate synthase [Amycolatopsis sp. Hca4]QKV80222.1 3,4-dihydroxy-2-butanone-4-phosphate synthase [Amycolatopsis sp. Hca4]